MAFRQLRTIDRLYRMYSILSQTTPVSRAIAQFAARGLTKRHLSPFALLIATVGLTTITGCASKLDLGRIEAAINQEIEAKGGVPVKAVDCPSEVKPEAGQSFACQVELSQGGTFVVTVNQQDDLGNVSWVVSSSRAMLNLTELEGYFQDQLKADTSTQPIVDCGTSLYRRNAPGDRFECKVVNAVAPDQSVIEAIAIQIDPTGNVSWQQVRRTQVAVAPAASAVATQPLGAAPSPQPSGTVTKPQTPAQTTSGRTGASLDFD